MPNALEPQSQRRRDVWVESARAIVDRQPHAVEKIPEGPRHAGRLAARTHITDIARAILGRGSDIMRVSPQRAELAEQDTLARDPVLVCPCGNTGKMTIDVAA